MDQDELNDALTALQAWQEAMANLAESTDVALNKRMQSDKQDATRLACR